MKQHRARAFDACAQVLGVRDGHPYRRETEGSEQPDSLSQVPEHEHATARTVGAGGKNPGFALLCQCFEGQEILIPIL